MAGGSRHPPVMELAQISAGKVLAEVGHGPLEGEVVWGVRKARIRRGWICTAIAHARSYPRFPGQDFTSDLSQQNTVAAIGQRIPIDSH